MRSLLFGRLDPGRTAAADGRITTFEMDRGEKIRRATMRREAAAVDQEMLEPDLGDAERELGVDGAGPLTDLGGGGGWRQSAGGAE